MGKSKHKSWSSTVWVLVSIGLLLIGVALLWLYYSHQDWEKHFQIIGSVCSAIGFIFAIIQIIHTRRASESAQDTVQSTLSDVNNYFSYAEVSKCEKLIDDIENIARQKSSHALAIKLKELKDSLIDFQANPELVECSNELERWVGIITTDILTYSSTWNSDYDFENTTSHVEEVKTVLTKIASKLKYKKYE